MKIAGNAGLILPGGGARAAYQVGVLKALAALTDGTALPFESISGISAGAINAMAVAQHADDFGRGVERLERVWTDMKTSDVFEMDYGVLQGFLAKSNKPTSLLDNSPLRSLLENQFGEGPSVAQQLDNGHLRGLAVTASNYSSGGATTFFQAAEGEQGWHTRRRDSVAAEIGVDHLMASAALPVLFPTVQIGDEHFLDGSLRMTEPLRPAIKLGADRILVIGVRNESLPVGDSDIPAPGIGEAAGYMLDSLFSENLNSDLERMEQINGLLRYILPWRRRRSGKRKIRVLVVRPSQDLRSIASRFSIDLPRGLRMFLRTVGGWGHEWRLPSYLLFQGRFTQELIELGYRDGLRLRPTIESFFAP